MRKIKLFLSMLMLIAFSVGNVWAADESVTFSAQGYTNQQEISSYTGTDFSIAFDKGTNSNAPKYFTSGTAIRAYGGNYFTVSSTKTIAKIELTFGSSDGSNAITTNVATYSNGTWNGSATSVQFTIGGTSGNRRLAGVAVTFAGADPVDVDVTGVTLDEDEIALEVGEKQTLTATVLPDNATNKNVTWESDDTDVATVENGLVTAVAPGTATITCKSADDATISATCDVTVTAAEVPTLTFDFSDKGYENGVQYSSINADANITITFGDGANDGKYYDTGTAIRVYSNGHMTVAGGEGVTISKILLEFGSGDGSNAISTTVGTYTAGKWTGSEQSVTFNVGGSSGNRRIKVVKVFYEAAAIAVAKPTISGETPFLTSTTVTLTQTDADHIYYTTNGDAPTTSSTLYSAPFEVNATTTIKAIAVKGSDESAVAEKTFTKQTVLTVADALVEATGSGKYVTGTITSITEVNLSYHNATYVISDISAGVPQNEMIVYRGKNIGGADFTSADEIHVGDVVVVSGSIAVHAEKNQMAQGNQIVTISAPAVAAPVFEPNGGGFMGETDVTITCATDGSTIYYTLDGTNPTKSSMLYEGAIHLDATTTITAIAYVGEESSLVVAKEFTLTAPMTVAEAYDALTGDDINNAAVAGIVYQVDNISSGHATYWISDNGEADEKVLEVYNGYGLNGASIAAGGIQVGDEVTVFGNLTIYVKNETSTKEFAAGSRLLAFNRPEVAVTGVSLTESTAEVEVGKTVNLHASVVPANATNKTIVWSVQSGDDYASVDENGVVTGIAAGEAVIRAASDENASIYEECTVTVTEPAPLSPWASVYTSNVTLSTEGGTSASAAKVKFYGEEGDGYDAIKAGTGSAQGAVVVNVPAGATALHFHAYGWNSESVGLTVTAPTGVTVSPATEISINSNSGIASNSPFTLAEGSDPKTEAYYAVSLSGNTEPVALTISATAGKRFVLFGVNQEGGLVLESIAVSGTASVLEYNDGDHFDPTGLVVTGHYSDDSEATISEGIDWTFDPDPLTEGTTSVSVTATVGEITSAAFPVNGLTVNGAAPLSPWATTWTSNLDDITGSKVKFYGEETEYAALKAGTGSVAGTATLNIPAQATELHLHAYGWNSEDVTLSITAPDGVTVTPASINLNRNSGFASNSPFTLAEGSTPQTDAYYALSLSGNTDAIELTISATEGKRFLLFGVNQVGGVLPELQSIAISGDLDNKSYKAGQALDMTGLTVTATYTLGGTPQTPVDVTNDPGLTWTYDPLAEGDTQKEVTANFGGKTANKTIEGLTVASADPKIYVSTLNVNFASVEVGESVPASETVTVTLTNVASVTATLGGTNPEAFSISPASLTESGDITISILANTDAAASYAATLTISDGEGGADDKTVNLSFAVTEPETPEDPEVRKTWDLSIASYDANPTEEQVTWSATYVNMVADKANSTTAANNYLGGANNRTSSRFYKNSTLTITPNAKEITSVVFTATSEGYANALQGSEWTNASASVDGTTVTVTPTDGKNAIIAVVGGTCGFTAVQVNYKNIAPEPPVVNYTEVRNDLTEGWYYTMCLDKAVTAVKAGSIWKVLSKAANGNDVILEEAELPLAAGRPYIFRAAASTLEVAYTGDEVLAPVNDADNHGLIGSFTQKSIAQSNDNYIIYNNALYFVNSDNVKVGAYRAYLDMTGVPAYSNEPQQGNAPRRRVTMAVHGPQVATGMESIQPSEISNQKVLINGQLFILRGEKMYDATGRLVK